jgi:hypothetical protein
MCHGYDAASLTRLFRIQGRCNKGVLPEQYTLLRSERERSHLRHNDHVVKTMLGRPRHGVSLDPGQDKTGNTYGSMRGPQHAKSQARLQDLPYQEPKPQLRVRKYWSARTWQIHTQSPPFTNECTSVEVFASHRADAGHKDQSQANLVMKPEMHGLPLQGCSGRDLHADWPCP